ncbi:GNAT family N-acetyltransferase [Thalassomonas viridans]|uniref:GNAT family N-acetyltransferase n=1 Tax=Thalassomonas viridans TaxID=137584 RepID=A0AAF0C6Z9_9GAMM|nr:GNAT family N-acetyltransferase [Thalassomonas viridans]WDE03178.1 GNAT family N-acetyltransferase [Thalassomonas viridans]
MEIRADDLTGDKIQELLSRHLHTCAQHSPPECVFALDLDGLRAPELSFWSVWQQGILLGCGALKELAPDHGEIKSMHTCQQQRGKGVASVMVEFIISEALKRNYRRLSLETGSMAAFAPAHKLYQKFGFYECPPFAGYKADPHSLFMTLTLNPAGNCQPVVNARSFYV